jgi:hypothetical protein
VDIYQDEIVDGRKNTVVVSRCQLLSRSAWDDLQHPRKMIDSLHRFILDLAN